MRLIVPLVAAACGVTLGCAAIERVRVPTELVVGASDERIEIDPLPGHATTRSIGDEVVRFSKSAQFAECCTTLLGRQVPLAGWRNTFVHAEGAGFSNRDFFSGDIGVVLDEEINVLRWIQIGGLRRWRQRAMSGVPLFIMERRYTSHWWLRYGGESDGNYRFEIVESPGDNQSEVIQPIDVSEAKFLDGFFVRGIGIQGLRPDRRGTIEYRTFEASE
ncbi:MAG: hypothetical protein IPK00_10480 [Deltaproteobacteria bacterium]|nr:hypothetical protein [Deltaproteobacteria bacterium]